MTPEHLIIRNDLTIYTEPACRECGAPDSSGLCDECHCEQLEREMDAREDLWAAWEGE